MAADALDSLESRNEDVSKMPELTMEHKLDLVLHQRQQLVIQVTIKKLEDSIRELHAQLEAGAVILNGKLIAICKDLNIDQNKWTFDLDKFKINPKDK